MDGIVTNSILLLHYLFSFLRLNILSEVCPEFFKYQRTELTYFGFLVPCSENITCGWEGSLATVARRSPPPTFQATVDGRAAARSHARVTLERLRLRATEDGGSHHRRELRNDLSFAKIAIFPVRRPHFTMRMQMSFPQSKQSVGFVLKLRRVVRAALRSNGLCVENMDALFVHVTPSVPLTLKVLYRVTLVVAHLSWVDFIFIRPLPGFADGSLAELAEQLGKILEHPNQIQPNPGARPPESPCSIPKSSRA